jgi:hypothetical protein
MCIGLGWEGRKGRELGRQDDDRKVISESILDKYEGAGMDWILLAQDGHRCTYVYECEQGAVPRATGGFWSKAEPHRIYGSSSRDCAAFKFLQRFGKPFRLRLQI